MRFITDQGQRISIKDPNEIELMKQGGKILALTLTALEKKVQAGMQTIELDEFAEKFILDHGGKPSFKGYQGYPATACISINDEIVHGIPGEREIKNGDIVTIDCGVIYEGFHTDSAITVAIGDVPSETINFINTCKLALKKAIETVAPGVRIGKLSAVIQKTVESAGYSVVRDLTGHGIGQSLHEDPAILNFVTDDQGIILRNGMTIAIEPIITMGRPEVKILRDGWTFVSRDHSLAAQVEHTVAVTEKGAEILTLRDHDIF